MAIVTGTAQSKSTKNRKHTTPAPELVTHIVEAVFSKKGSDVTVVDLRTVTGVSDFFVVCTGDSELKIKAIADAVKMQIKTHCEGELPWHVEGYTERRWILMDYVDVVVHIFDPERRLYYDLERLWADASIEHVSEDQAEIALLRTEG